MRLIICIPWIKSAFWWIVNSLPKLIIHNKEYLIHRILLIFCQIKCNLNLGFSVPHHLKKEYTWKEFYLLLSFLHRLSLTHKRVSGVQPVPEGNTTQVWYLNWMPRVIITRKSRIFSGMMGTTLKPACSRLRMESCMAWPAVVAHLMHSAFFSGMIR